MNHTTINYLRAIALELFLKKDIWIGADTHMPFSSTNENHPAKEILEKIKPLKAWCFRSEHSVLTYDELDEYGAKASDAIVPITVLDMNFYIFKL